MIQGAAEMFPRQHGPCVICGDTDYSLSCGGPTICPKCDCGMFDAATVMKQAKDIERLRSALSNVQKIISEAALTGFNYKDGDWPERLFHSQQATSAALKQPGTVTSHDPSGTEQSGESQ